MNDTVTATSLPQLADEIARSLAHARMLDGRAYIRTPVLFPSGATAVVVIEEEGDGRYRLSDLGQGLEEASQLGAAPTYQRQAQEVAQLSGLRLEGGAFVLPAIEADQLPAGTITVANASVRALERTMLRATQRPPEASLERLVTRLSALFPRATVAREAELRGASTHAWTLDALLTTEIGRTAFDLVTPHPTSVVFATAKFHDIARLEHAPARIAVVHRKASLGDLLNVVAQVASVIEDDAPDRTLLHAVGA